MKSIFFGLSLLLASGTAQGSAVKDRMAFELTFIKGIFETGYAPINWKKDHFGYNLQEEYQKSLDELSSKDQVDSLAYTRVLKNFVTSTRDYHVGARFVFTEKATLPFLVKGVKGRYFVVWVDSEKLGGESAVIKTGDELLKFGDRPIVDVIAELLLQTKRAELSTDMVLTELTLTSRSAARGLEVPRGLVNLEFKRTGGETYRRQLSWSYTPESVEWPLNAVPASLAKNKPAFQVPQMVWSSWDVDGEDKKPKDNPFEVGGRKTYVPRLGSLVWESQDKAIFDAYIYKLSGGKLIGYIRIPHYMGGTPAYTEFRELIKKFEEVTDGLVIDQINNPGGSVAYIYALMSLLNPNPTKVPDHHIAVWPDMIREYAEMEDQLRQVSDDKGAQKAFGGVDNLDGFPVNFQLAQSFLRYAREIRAEWRAGKRLTAPLHLWGVDRVNPNSDVSYTKPILVLTNELDFSGGDFFPAILQDNVRAKVFGQRTSGAGGYVLSVEFPSAFGLKSFSFTGSLARRVNDQPIENLGVTPDIAYEHTVNDLTSGFGDYKNAINAAITEMVSK